jgi:hypothetical protein
MKKIMFLTVIFLFMGLWSAAAPAVSRKTETKKEELGFGVYGGVGTDINLGIGYGIKCGFFPMGVRNVPLEVGPELFIAHTVEDSSEGNYDYTDTTDLVVFGVLASYLFNYSYKTDCFYGILGIGLAVVSVSWEETSPNDTSLGESWKGGSKMSAEGTVGGSVLNLGFGYSFAMGLDIRFELPVIIMFGAPGEASAIAPAVTAMAGYRF